MCEEGKEVCARQILILHAKYEAYQMHFNPSFDAHQKSRRHTLVSRKESSGNILK
jgi:hypothetical protein